MTSPRRVLCVLLVSVLAGCSPPPGGEHDVGDGGVPPVDDGGSPPVADDGGAPPVADDGGTPPTGEDGGPRVDCSPRELVRGNDLQLDRMVVGGDGRLAITWWRPERTATTSVTRAFVEIVGTLGTSDVAAREIGDSTILPIEGGYAAVTGYPLAAVALVDLDGAPTRSAIALPEGWQVNPERLVAEGSLLRGEAWVTSSTGEVTRPTFELELAGSAPEPTVIGVASDDVLVREMDRELLVRIGTAMPALIERTLPGATAALELAWPEGMVPVLAQLDASRDRWLVLGTERVLDESGRPAGKRPVIVSVPRDGRGAQVTRIEVGDPMRTVAGSMAIGPDAALLAIDDYHGRSYLVRVALDTLAHSAPVEIEGMWNARVVWHEATESFALATQSTPYEELIAVTFRCGL